MAVNPYLKFIIAVLGALVIVLQTAYGAAHWAQPVAAGITAILVYLAPNTPKAHL